MAYEGKRPLLVIATPCEQYVEALKGALSDADYRVFQSFDLQSTSALQMGCSCKADETAKCGCYMTVLLIYPDTGDPETVIVDGRDELTFVYLIEKSEGYSPETANKIARVIEKTTLMLYDQLATNSE